MLSLCTWVNLSTFTQKAAMAKGVVVELKSHLVTSARKTPAVNYYLKISFKAEDGKEYSATSVLFSSNPWPYYVGKKVKIIYPLKNPDNAKIYDFMSFWNTPVIFLGLGALLLALGITIPMFNMRK